MFSLAVLVVLGQVSADGDLFEATVEAHRACKLRKGGGRVLAGCSDGVAAGYEAFLRLRPQGEQADLARFYLAEMLYDDERYDEAGPLYQRVGEGTGKYAAVARYNRVLALAESRSRDPTAFVAACDDFVRADPGSEDAPRVAYAAAHRVWETGRASEAERRFEDVFARWPTSSDGTSALYGLLERWRAEGAVRRLIAFSRKLRADSAPVPTLANAAAHLAGLAQELWLADRLDEAAALLEEAALAGDGPDAMLRAALLYLDAGEPDHAADAFDALLARWPTSDAAARARMLAALTDARLGRTARARQRFVEAGRQPVAPEPVAGDEALFDVGDDVDASDVCRNGAADDVDDGCPEVVEDEEDAAAAADAAPAEAGADSSPP